jgi:hypothetical protein
MCARHIEVMQERRSDEPDADASVGRRMSAAIAAFTGGVVLAVMFLGASVAGFTYLLWWIVGMLLRGGDSG